MMQGEIEAMEVYSRQAEHAADPALKLLFWKLADMRFQCYAELESRIREMNSQSEITGQINAMFSRG